MDSNRSAAEYPTSGVMWFMRGQCTQCGKLSPPIYADPDDDDMLALGRLQQLVKSVGWHVDIFRAFSGPKPGIKCIFRCKICEKEFQEMSRKGEATTSTTVSALPTTPVASKGTR